MDNVRLATIPTHMNHRTEKSDYNNTNMGRNQKLKETSTLVKLDVHWKLKIGNSSKQPIGKYEPRKYTAAELLSFIQQQAVVVV